MIIPNPDWNPCTEMQAIARAHRAGQRKTVMVHRLSLHDAMGEFSTIDERIFEIQGVKRRLVVDLLQKKNDLSLGTFDTSSLSTKALIGKLSGVDVDSLLS